jgi:hypothetical protein
LRSSGDEIIGLGKWWRDFPVAVGLLLEHAVRIGPYYLPTTKVADSLPTPHETDWSRRVRQEFDHRSMTKMWREHSLRTWYFAAASPDADRVDPDLLYVACLLHDIGLFADPAPGESFAHAGARIAESTARDADVDPKTAERVATAVRGHISMAPDSELGRLVQVGSLLDLTATGIWQLDRGLVAAAYRDHPRTGFAKDARDRWKKECDRLPLGRAAYARRPGGLVVATRFAPLCPMILRESRE